MPKLAITNAHIMPIDGPEIAAGTILIDGSTIAAIGNGVVIPSDAEVIDAAGQLALPGMLDAHTHLGVHEEGVGWEGSDTNESTDPVTPHVRALDGINPEELGLLDTAAHGVTTAVVLPGSANVVGGLGAIIKTSGRFVDRMVVRAECGLKVAFGENPKRVYGDRKQLPSTRMGVAAVLRETLVQAQVYLRKLEQGVQDPDKAPDRDLRLETVGRVLQREIPLLAHCHRADDILTVLRIAAEFEVDVILEHATEAHRIVEEIAARRGALRGWPDLWHARKGRAAGKDVCLARHSGRRRCPGGDLLRSSGPAEQVPAPLRRLGRRRGHDGAGRATLDHADPGGDHGCRRPRRQPDAGQRRGHRALRRPPPRAALPRDDGHH